MNKATVILLALFVAWSAVQPCTDGQPVAEPEGNCSVEAATNLPATSSHGCCAAKAEAEKEKGCEDEEQENGCSPFCSCQCCGMVFLQFIPEYKPVPSPLPHRQMMAYLPQQGQEFPHFIWQPPPHQS